MQPEHLEPLEPVVVRGERYFSASDIVRSLGISRQTFWRWRTAGHVPAGRRHRTGSLFFDEEELQAIQAYATQLTPLEQPEPSSDRASQELGEGDSR